MNIDRTTMTNQHNTGYLELYLDLCTQVKAQD
jgi:hypothetical protein